MNDSKKNIKIILSLFLVIGVSVAACKTYISHSFRQTYSDYNTIIHKDSSEIDYLKIHFLNGDVAVMDSWLLNENMDSLYGQGVLYDFNRNNKSTGMIAFELSTIALIETNMLDSVRSKDDRRIAGLAIILGLDVILDAICLAMPKACFGSCPTFYVDDEQGLQFTRAESFSCAISPSMESADIDNLKYSTRGGEFELTMRNEALETHAINKIELLAVARSPEHKTYHNKQGQFIISNNETTCLSATHNNKEVKMYFDQADEFQFKTQSDSLDLFERDTVYIDFFNDNNNNEKTLVINLQQSLMTTFLFYSALSYMGDEVGDYMAFLERENENENEANIFSPFLNLNRLHISIWNSTLSQWKDIGFISEIGPIAHIIQSISLPPIKSNKIRLRLDMTKGYWKIDQILMADIISQIEPCKLSPLSTTPVFNQFSINHKDVLYADQDYMITFPGDEVSFLFNVPPSNDEMIYDLFINAQGYYIEWMRKDWLIDKDIKKFKNLITNNSSAWTELAIKYKENEADMEETFFNTKYSIQ